MTNSLPVQTGLPLCAYYRRTGKIIEIASPPVIGLKKHSQEVILAPVLFHGTERYVIERWRKNQIECFRLCLVSSPIAASDYATYYIDKKQVGFDIVLSNGPNRRIQVAEGTAEIYRIIGEYNRLKMGRVVNSVALFDRDSVLHFTEVTPDVDLFYEVDYPENGVTINTGPSSEMPKLPFSSLIASLELDMEVGQVSLRVFSQRLWEKNFSMAVPDLSSLGPFTSMYEVAKVVLYRGPTIRSS